MKKALFHILFFMLFAIHLSSIYAGYKNIQMISKPLICLFLILYLNQQTQLKTSFHKLICLGLLFGCMGDVFLMLPDQFLLGLGAFLIGHICYTLAFLKQCSFNDSKRHKSYLFVLGILLIYTYHFYQVLAPSLGIEKYPVIAYIIIIAAMAFFAYLRKYSCNTISFILIFVGSILFIISDSVLAINKFVVYIPNAGILIMSTYMLAQYGITVGSVHYQNRIK